MQQGQRKGTIDAGEWDGWMRWMDAMDAQRRFVMLLGFCFPSPWAVCSFVLMPHTFVRPSNHPCEPEQQRRDTQRELHHAISTSDRLSGMGCRCR